MLTIRDFTPADYPAIADLHNACFSTLAPTSAKKQQAEDARREAKYAFDRVVACDNGKIVGVATTYEPWFFYKPGRWLVDVLVSPPHQDQGIGRKLWAHIEGYLANRPTTLLFAGALEGSSGVSFAKRRGFKIKVREAFSKLDLTQFDPSRLVGVDTRLSAHGLRIITGTEALVSIPDAYRQWWDLHWAINQDIPFNRPLERIPFEVFLKYFDEADHDNDLWFLACEGDKLVGVSGLKPTPDPKQMLTAVTGVIREHRRKGVATALKLSTIRAALAYGAESINTDNEEDNPMLAINLKLGFEEFGAWMNLECER